MKKKTLLMALSIIEIITIILFIVTFKTAFSKSSEIVINELLSKWVSTKEIILTPREKFIMKINSITPYIFFITILIRFIFTNKKGKIAIGITIPTTILSLYLIFANPSQRITIIITIGLILAVVTVIAYIYSHIIYFKDNYKIKNK